MKGMAVLFGSSSAYTPYSIISQAHGSSFLCMLVIGRLRLFPESKVSNCFADWIISIQVRGRQWPFLFGWKEFCGVISRC